jgi:hypothetical protein
MVGLKDNGAIAGSRKKRRPKKKKMSISILAKQEGQLRDFVLLTHNSN